MKVAATMAFVVIAMALPAGAQAHLVTKPKSEKLEARAASQSTNLKHARYVCNRGARDHKRWACTAVRWLQRELGETRASMAPVRPPHYQEWLCIHSYEGAWNANTGNGYYGGLQMDYSFMQTYGGELLRSKGTADNWTPLEQMWVAERAYRTRGFGPWPNTARHCGLL